MDRMRRAVILTELMERLGERGSWCGEAGVQRAVFFLQEVLRVPTGYRFLPYKGRLHSFELAEDLVALRSDYLVGHDHRASGYGPALVPTEPSRRLRARYPSTLRRYRRRIALVARKAA